MKDESLHIDLIEKVDDKEWLFKIVRRVYPSENSKNISFELKTITKVLIEFSIDKKCIYEGCQVFHPVDFACDEPSEYKREVELEEVNIVTFDDSGEYDTVKEWALESDEYDLIIQHIADYYEF